MTTITQTQAGDIADVSSILDATELFPSEYLSQMIAEFLEGTNTSEIWLRAHRQDHVSGFCYAVAEEFTDGTWNMRAIAVALGEQGRGIGKAITTALEDILRAQGARVLLADTSGTEDSTQLAPFTQPQDTKKKRAFVISGQRAMTKSPFTKRFKADARRIGSLSLL
ncbi:MAG: GNAT family N-acetyltransferase [Roseobacter sp.]